MNFELTEEDVEMADTTVDFLSHLIAEGDDGELVNMPSAAAFKAQVVELGYDLDMLLCGLTAISVAFLEEAAEAEGISALNLLKDLKRDLQTVLVILDADVVEFSID